MLNLIDGFFALMAIPTMTATLIMAPRVLTAAKDYFERMNKSEIFNDGKYRN